MSDGVDLSNVQTISFGNGVGGYYDPSSGSYYDSGGNPLSASELAQYGAFTVTSGPAAPAQTVTPTIGAPGAVQPAGSGGTLAGITGLFSSLGTGIVNALTRPTTVSTPQGTMIYNPNTGTYTTPQAITANAAISPILLLIGAGLVVWLVVRST
jgi:hypothetical protein